MNTTRMKVSDLHPQVQKQVARMPTIELRNPVARIFMKTMMKVMFRAQPDSSVRTHTVDLEDLSLRVYEPNSDHRGAGLIFIHGGGYVLGEAKMSDPDCNRLVKALGVTVVSVDYRLAPKHPFPAPLDDCFNAWSWFQENAERLEVDRSRLAIAGQSAGGGLAAALCQRILDEGGVQPAAQILYYPMIDDRTALNASLTDIRHIAWNNANNFYGWSVYLGRAPHEEPELRPWAVPSRRVDLSNLPPAWIGVGDKDLFHQENVAYATKLSDSNVACELEVVQGAPHGFDALVPDAEVSQAFRESSFRFLRKHLGIRS